MLLRRILSYQPFRLPAFAVLAFVYFHPLVSSAQADTIIPGNNRLVVSALNPGLRQYLVYFQNPKTPGRVQYFWLWMRELTRETSGGEKVIAIRQHWIGRDSVSYRTYFSLNAAKDFAPLYHAESAGNKINAYNWSTTGIRGADTVAGNMKQGFALDFTTPNFNWNLDIELFELLPLAKGKQFAINFYDAGLSPPKYELYKVIGSEIITTLNNKKVDCWKLNTTGTSATGITYSETFWISKKEHEFLKEEDAFNGGFRYKVKLPGLAPDIMKRFN